MAGENVVPGGAIAVNLTLNDPQGIMTGGGTPSAPGAGGKPSGGGGGRSYAGFLSPEQREELELARQQQEYAKEQSEYNRLVKKELPAEKEATSALRKFLPMLGGVFGIAAIVQSSKVVQGTMGTIGQLLGALVDIFLMPFIPVIAKVIGVLASIVGGIASFIQDPLGFIVKTWNNIFAAAKEGWEKFWKDLGPAMLRSLNPLNWGKDNQGGAGGQPSTIGSRGHEIGSALLKGAAGGAGLGTMIGLGASAFSGGAALPSVIPLAIGGAITGAMVTGFYLMYQKVSEEFSGKTGNTSYQASVTNYITVGDTGKTPEEQIRTAKREGNKNGFEFLDWMKFAFAGF